MRKTARHFLAILLMLSMLLGIASTAQADACPYSADGGHHYALVSETPATCTTEGAKVYTCTNMGESGMPCGASYTETIPATGHQWDSGSMTQAPTCTTDGVMTYTCTGRNLKGAACGATKTEAIPATGHSPRTESGKAATCTEDGYTEVSVCGICGEVLKARESIPALGHAWDSGTVTQAATCTSDGVKTIKCTRCGVTRTEAIPATGHSPVTVPGKAATCTEAGLTDGSKCSVCGTTLTAQNTIPAKGHSPVTVPGKAATCTEAGLTDGSKCSVCGTTLTAQNTIPAKGHSPVAVPGKATTCTEAGLTDGSKCSVCGTVLTAQQSTAAPGHSWNGGTVTKEATENAEGVKTYTCTRCGATKTEAIPKLAHTHVYGEWKVEQKGSCIKRTMYRRDCSCGAEEYQYGEYGDHEWGEWTTSKEPTATEDGLKERVCKNNANHKEQQAIPATGENEAPKPALYFEASIDENAGDGKRYTGAVIPIHYKVTNTGNCPVYKHLYYSAEDVYFPNGSAYVSEINSTAAVINPGESWTFVYSFAVSEKNVENGYIFCYYGKEFALWIDTDASVKKVNANSIDGIKVPLTYPDSPNPSISVKLWADPNAGVGKRYEGAIVPIHEEITNTGDCSVYVHWEPDLYSQAHDASAPNGRTEVAGMGYGNGVALLNPGETYTEIYDHTVDSNEVSDGCFWAFCGKDAWYYDANGKISSIYGWSNDPKIDLTYPGDMDPEAVHALKLVKGIDHGPDNGSYFQVGESIPWTLTVTNTSEKPVKNVVVTDDGVTVGSFAEIAPGDTVMCSVPVHVVTEYEAEVTGSVSNIATATGEDENGYPHSWVSNPISVPTSAWSTISLPGITPDDGIIPGGTPGGTPVDVTPGGIPGGTPVDVTPGGIPGGTPVDVTPSGGFDPGMLPIVSPGLEPVLGPDGKPILGPDGVPIYAPIGTVPVLGPDGKPLVTAEGWPVLMLPDGIFVAVTPMGPILCNKNGYPILDPWGNYIFITFDEDTLYCNLKLDALGNNEMDHTLHACSSHILPALQTLAAEPAEAVAIWQEEIGKMYDLLWEAGNDLGKAAAEKDRAAFETYTDAFRTLYGDKETAEMLRLRCAELCCIIHTVPDALPDSLLGDYATLMSGITYDICERVFGEVFGGDCEMDVHLNAAMSNALRKTQETVSTDTDNAFATALIHWQMALDRMVNTTYKAADREQRAAIAAWRRGLDQMYAAREELLMRLYPENDLTVRERLMNLYRDAAIEAYIGK